MSDADFSARIGDSYLGKIMIGHLTDRISVCWSCAWNRWRTFTQNRTKREWLQALLLMLIPFPLGIALTYFIVGPPE